MNRNDPEFDPTPYRKADGQWYVQRKVDRTTFVEKLATEEEIEVAKAAARAALASFDEPVVAAPKPAAKKATTKAKGKK